MTPDQLAAKIATHPDIAALPVYLAYCADCGGMVGCSTDTPDRKKENARFAAECINSGLTIARGCTADVWGSTWCKCRDEKEDTSQPSLF